MIELPVSPAAFETYLRTIDADLLDSTELRAHPNATVRRLRTKEAARRAGFTTTEVRHPGYDTIDYLSPLPAPFEVPGTYGDAATHVLRWYNAQERSWVVSYADANGGQVGSSEYVYSAIDAFTEAVDLFVAAR